MLCAPKALCLGTSVLRVVILGEGPFKRWSLEGAGEVRWEKALGREVKLTSPWVSVLPCDLLAPYVFPMHEVMKPRERPLPVSVSCCLDFQLPKL